MLAKFFQNIFTYLKVDKKKKHIRSKNTKSRHLRLRFLKKTNIYKNYLAAYLYIKGDNNNKDSIKDNKKTIKLHKVVKF